MVSAAIGQLRTGLIFLFTMIAASFFAHQSVAQGGPQSLPQMPLTIETRDGSKYNFTVEIADELLEQRIGLMHRDAIADDHGMLFLYSTPQRLNFWMKNTLVPLDILYIQSDGRIANIAAMTTPLSLKSIPSRGRVLAALELRGGRAEELGIRPGDKILHPAFVDMTDCEY